VILSKVNSFAFPMPIRPTMKEDLYGFLFAYCVMCKMLKIHMYNVTVGSKPEGKRPLGIPRRRWVDTIRMDLQEVGCRYMDWPRIETGGGRL